MKQIFASSTWTRVIGALIVIFIAWSITRIVSVKRQQAELARQAGVISKLNGMAQSVFALQQSLEPAGPDSSWRWRALYSDYRTRRQEFDPGDPNFRELQVNLIRTDSLLIHLSRLQADWWRAGADPLGQKTLQADFYREINLATAEIQNAVQTIRARTGTISAAMAENSNALFILLLAACALALAATWPLRLLQQDLAKIKEADEALRVSAEHLRQTFEQAPGGIAVMTPAGKFMQVNPAFCRLLGYAETELRQRNIAEVSHAEDWAAHRDGLRRLQSGEISSFQLEQRYLTKRRQTVHTFLQASAVREANGTASQFIAQVIDMTERRHAELAREQSVERFRELSENIAEVFWLTDPAKNEVFYVNPAYEKIWDRSRQSLYETPQAWIDAIHPDDRERVRKAALTKQVIGQYDETFRIQRPDGETRWVRDRAFPVRDELGSVYRIAGIAEDVTGRKQTELALHEVERRWSFAIEGSAAGVWDWEVQTNKVFYSRRWKEMLGYQEHEIGDSLDECYSRLHPEDLPAMVAALEKHLRGETPLYVSEHRERCRDGRYKWIQDRGKVITRSADGKPLRVVGTHTDIDEQAQAKTELSLTHSRLNTFMANLQSGILCEDKTRHVVYVNQKFCDLFGIPVMPAACVGMDYRIAAEQAQNLFVEKEKFVPRLEEILAAQRLVTNEELRLQDGRIFERDYIPIFAEKEYVGHLWHYRDITAIKQAAEEVRKSAEQFRLTFEMAPIGMTITGIDGGLAQCNRAFCEMLGYTAEELQKKTWVDVTHQNEVSTNIAFRERLLRGDIPNFQMQNRYLAKTGQVVHAQLQMTLIKDEQDRPLHFISQVLNLTALKETQGELTRQSVIMRAIVESMTDGVVVADAAGKFLVLNPAAENMIGVSAMETGSPDWAEKYGLYLPDQITHVPIAQNPMARAMHNETASTVDMFVRNPQRPRGVWLSVTGTPLRDEEGKVLGGVVVFRDVTVQKQAEEALRKNEEQFRLTFDHAPIGMAISSIDGAILQVNQAYCDILGRTSEELINRSVMEFTHPEDNAENLDLTRQLLRGEIPHYQMEKRYLAKDGHVVYAILTASVVRDRDGQPLHFIGQIDDITERQQAEEEVRKLNAELEQRVIERTKALRESEERFRALYDDNPSIYFTVDTEGVLLSVNHFGAEELGYEAAELAGEPVTKIFSEEDRTKARQYINTCLKNPGRSFTWELRMARKNDSKLWVREYARTAHDHTGKAVVFVVCEDITSRRQAEVMLQASEARLRKQNESLGDLVRGKTFQNGNLQEALQAVTEMAARCMEVERVSVWFYDEARTKMICRDLFELNRQQHTAGVELEQKDFLPYFEALSQGRDIDAYDAQNDYRTRCFHDSYLRPLGITSMLDAPIRLRGELVGVLCHEHVGTQRQWTLDEQVFVGALADLVAQALEAHERGRAEQALRDSEERYRTLVEQMPDGIYRRTPDGRFVEVNPAMYQMFGYASKEEFLGLDLPAALDFNPDERNGAMHHFKPGITIARQRHKDGHEMWVEDHSRLIYDDRGNVLYNEGILRDITARKKAEDALQESETRFRTLIETMNDGLVQLDEKGLLTYVNDKMCEMTGFSREEMLGREVLPRLEAESRDILHKQIERRQAGESKPYEMEVRKQDGGKLPVLVSPQPIFGCDGYFNGSFAVVTDISERKRLEEQIRRHAEELEQLVEERTKRIRLLEQQRAESEKLAATGRMSARIAHEINNPLAGIKNSFLLVKDGIPTTHRYYDYVRRIETEIERIARIVRQMFDLYRPQQDSVRSFPADIAIRDVVALLGTNCRERDITIDVEIDAPALNVALSEGSLRQVLYNVIQNAVDASTPGSLVRVRAFAERQKLTINVIDQGQGIPEEIRPKIFEPFFTTKSGLERSGLGLGLSVSKGLVEAMGGKLDFESSVGQGTTFAIVLPLDSSSNKLAAAPAPPETVKIAEIS